MDGVGTLLDAKLEGVDVRPQSRGTVKGHERELEHSFGIEGLCFQMEGLLVRRDTNAHGPSFILTSRSPEAVPYTSVDFACG
jgi:hypothetical protein